MLKYYSPLGGVPKKMDHHIDYNLKLLMNFGITMNTMEPITVDYTAEDIKLAEQNEQDEIERAITLQNF